MDLKNLPDHVSTSSPPLANLTVPPYPTVNVHLTEAGKRKDTNIWAPFYALGVVGCMYLLFHLYVTTTFHHAAMDRGLHKLEEEVHAMMEMHHTAGNATASGIVAAPVVTTHAAHIEDGHRALASHILPHERSRHHHPTRHARSRMARAQPAKRGGSTLTWFHPGTGACGGHNGDNDFIIAISHLIWNGGGHCGDTVTISYRGKTAQATVVDECMGCDPGHIDLSPGLLHHLAGPGTDMVTDASWTFGAPEPPKPKPKPKPTTHYESTTKAKPTYSSTSSTRASSTSTSSSSASSSTALYATPSGAPTYVDDGGVHNVEDINVLLVNLGGIVLAGTTAEG